jgi:hypothetical protein
MGLDYVLCLLITFALACAGWEVTYPFIAYETEAKVVFIGCAASTAGRNTGCFHIVILLSWIGLRENCSMSAG